MRNYTDWQFFNRKPQGSRLLLQACYSGRLWDVGFGVGPARIWIGRYTKTDHKYAFHFHVYLPFARRCGHFITFFGRVSAGYRRKDGKWRELFRSVQT